MLNRRSKAKIWSCLLGWENHNHTFFGRSGFSRSFEEWVKDISSPLSRKRRFCFKASFIARTALKKITFRINALGINKKIGFPKSIKTLRDSIWSVSMPSLSKKLISAVLEQETQGPTWFTQNLKFFGVSKPGQDHLVELVRMPL